MERPGPVLIICHDVVGPHMAGPGIRYTALAQELSREFPVVLAAPEGSTWKADAPFRFVTYRLSEDQALAQEAQAARAILIPALWLAHFPGLQESETPLVIDGYDPFVAETLALGGDERPIQEALALAYARGDFFICASERQRDWWLGLLEASGRVNRAVFQDDPSLRRLVDVVPYGLPEEPPVQTRPVVKGVWPGIAPQDRVILWGGGLWPWLDPLTAIRAMARLWPVRQDLRLIFPGTRHPNPEMAQTPNHVEAARELARELGLLDRAVFFGEWIPFQDWPNVLLESDVALSLHLDSLETRLAFRSRVLDTIWAGLPVVTTRGDATSELIERYRLGVVTDYQDADGVAQAILGLLETPRSQLEPRFQEARAALTWSQACRPLMAFCRRPRPAADRAQGTSRPIPSPCQEETDPLEQRIRELEALVAGYERGRFIRSMAWIKQRLGRA